MKIVVLDGYTTNPGDISWEPLEKLGELTVYDDTEYEQIPLRAEHADAVILNRCVLDENMIKELKELKFIGMLATGYNAIDTAFAKSRGIPVCNVPYYCIDTVAQHAFSLLLALCSKAHLLDKAVREDGWNAAVTASGSSLAMTELRGRTLGILGYGGIGQAMAKLGEAFGMSIIFYNRSKKDAPKSHRQTELSELFEKSDAISVHCPLNEETRGIVSRELIFKMKSSAFLINTARGAVVDSAALAEALDSGRIAGAGIDVFSKEPPEKSDPLLSAKNCIITPHIAWSSREARTRLIETVAENLDRFINGKPQNVVNL